MLETIADFILVLEKTPALHGLPLTLAMKFLFVFGTASFLTRLIQNMINVGKWWFIKFWQIKFFFQSFLEERRLDQLSFMEFVTKESHKYVRKVTQNEEN